MATPNDIYNEITRIDNAKQGIAEAIEEKGVQVPAGTPIQDFPGKVRQIQQGSANAVLYTPQELTPEQKAQARQNIGATEHYFRLLGTIDCSTLPVGGSIVIDDSDGLSEIVFIWERMIGATSTASQFALYEYNNLSGGLGYQNVIRYSASNNANGLSGITRMWYDGFLWFYNTGGANSPTNYAVGNLATPYNVNQNTFGQGKIKHLVLSSNRTFPVASGIVKIYGR